MRMREEKQDGSLEIYVTRMNNMRSKKVKFRVGVRKMLYDRAYQNNLIV